VMVVMQQGVSFEVATFRTDAPYLDGRRPSGITFSDEKQDALRRDFTVNGLFYDPFADEVLDFVGGIPDLEKKVIRTIGNPKDRFEEDKLRLLRAVRFTAKLGFSLDPETFSCLKTMAAAIEVVSRERIRDEVFKIFQTPKAQEALLLIQSSGLYSPVFFFDFFESALKLFQALPAQISPELKLLSLHPQPEVAALRVMIDHFKLSGRQAQRILFTHELTLTFSKLPEARLALQKRVFRNPDFEEAFLFLKAFQPLMAPENGGALSFLSQQYESQKECLHPPRLISGEDLKKVNLAPSPLFKLILEEIENLQLENRIHTRTEALKMMEELRRQHESEI